MASSEPASSGSFFDQQSFQPLFEDIRAHRVGDTVRVAIAAKTSSGKNIVSSRSQDNKARMSAVAPLGIASMQGKNALSSAEKAAANAANNFTGTMTATVTEVLTNGNLRVRGEE